MDQLRTRPTRFYILRHAETDKNILKKKNENKDKDKNKDIDLNNSSLLFDKNCKLNHNGKIQASIVADYFASIDHKICAIYSSPLIRAVETADIIFKHLNCDADFDVDDRLFGGKKNKSTEESMLINDTKDLINELIDEHTGYDILLITHNHIFNILCKLFVNKDNPCKFKVDNCSMSCIDFSNNKEPSIVFWNKKIKITYELI